MNFRILRRLAAGALTLAALPCFGQDASSVFLVLKGRLYSQTADASPVPLSTGGATITLSVPGFDGPPLATGGQVVLPGGTKLQLAYDGDRNVFATNVVADTPAALAATYPPGNYAFALNTSVLGDLTGTVVLPADAFPVAPQAADYAGAQKVDAAQDYTLQFKPLAGATSADSLHLQIVDGTDVIFDDSLSATETSDTVAAQTLSPGKTYQVIARFQQGKTLGNGFPDAGYGFFSETHFSLKTTGQSGGGDTTPPQLVSAYPTNGATGVFASAPIIFTFSEPMNPDHVGIQWTGDNLDPAKFNYSWQDNNTTLLCYYLPSLPPSHVSWVLNPVAGAASNFRDVAGNELPANQSAGTFAVSGATGSCAGAGAIESAGFGLIKQVNYLQTNAAAPVPDPTNAASAYAFVSYPLATGTLPPIVGLEFPAPPAPPPHKLDFLSATSLTGTGLSTLTQSFSGRSDLDTAFPAESYAFQLRNASVAITNQVVLQVLAIGYPTTPQFANYAAAQAVNPTNNFTLSWNAFANPGSNDVLSVEITDAKGGTVFQAPDTCRGLTLPATATSVTVPAGTLSLGASYVATLTFFHVTDQQPNPANSTLGVTALARATRMVLQATGTLPPPDPAVFNQIRLTDAHTGLLVITVSPNRNYVIQTSAGRGATSAPTNRSLAC